MTSSLCHCCVTFSRQRRINQDSAIEETWHYCPFQFPVSHLTGHVSRNLMRCLTHTHLYVFSGCLKPHVFFWPFTQGLKGVSFRMNAWRNRRTCHVKQLQNKSPEKSVSRSTGGFLLHATRLSVIAHDMKVVHVQFLIAHHCKAKGKIYVISKDPVKSMEHLLWNDAKKRPLLFPFCYFPVIFCFQYWCLIVSVFSMEKIDTSKRGSIKKITIIGRNTVHAQSDENMISQ